MTLKELYGAKIQGALFAWELDGPVNYRKFAKSFAPQASRIDDKKPGKFPGLLELSNLNSEQLETIGCGEWARNKFGNHWLFPIEWFNQIPVGTIVYSITDEFERFHRGKRFKKPVFGMMACGFIEGKLILEKPE